MIEKFRTQLILTEDDAEAMSKLFRDFSEACKASGIWSRAGTQIQPDGHGRASITVALVIDDSLRFRPGPDPKKLSLSVEDMQAMMESGMAPEQVATKAGISRATLFRRIAASKKKKVDHAY